MSANLAAGVDERAEVAENIPEEQNPLLTGAIDLSEEQVVEEPPMEEEIVEEQTNIIEEQ